MEALNATGLNHEDPDRPQVEDASILGGSIWIVLFGCVIALSTVANVTLMGLLAFHRKKRSSVYLLHCLMFAVNVVDYCLLSFELSLGIVPEFKYGETACKAYQMATKGNPIFQSFVVVTLLYYTTRKHDGRRRGANGKALKLSCTLLGLLAAVGAASVPTAYFATIVTENHNKFCEIDTSTSFLQISGIGRQSAISIYYLVYTCALPYWIPLLIALKPLIRLSHCQSSNKDREVCITASTSISFFVFYLPHDLIILVRHLLDALGHQLSPYSLWMVKIGQSLLWLVAYFWHVARPALLMSLDPDLKQSLLTLGGCCRRRPGSGNRTVTTNELVQKGNSLVVSVVDGQDQERRSQGNAATTEEGVLLLSPVAALLRQGGGGDGDETAA